MNILSNTLPDTYLNTVIAIPGCLLIFIVCGLIQKYLSIRPNKYLGLILPAVQLLVMIFGFVFMDTVYKIFGFSHQGKLSYPTIVTVLVVPLAAYLLIYFVWRIRLRKAARIKNEQDVSKMQIQDL